MSTPPAGYYWGEPAYTQPVATMPPGGTQTATIANRLVHLPVATVSCTPNSLPDKEDQVATCTVALSGEVPAAGLDINFTLPAAGNSRYTTSCTSPLHVGATLPTASCTVTATPNTTPGDGSVVATLTLLPGAGYALGSPASATVTITDDDAGKGLNAVPTLGKWALMLLGLVMAGSAGWRRRQQ